MESDNTAPQKPEARPAGALIVSGVLLGALADALLRAPGEPGLNMFLWVLGIAVAAVVLQRRTGMEMTGGRLAWLSIAVLFAAGFTWRDSEPLKVLALGCATLALAVAAYRLTASWVTSAGVFRYVGAWGTGAFHAWTAAGRALVEAGRLVRPENVQTIRWQRSKAVLRGLLIATPLVLVFGALFMSADAVFADLVVNAFRFDFETIASHLVIFALAAWLATGYLRGFLKGTELPPFVDQLEILPRRPTLGITEVATVLGALNLLFLMFVSVQFRYLFGGDALIRVTPDLTYAEYARRGFFELVFAVALVVPVLLATDWLLTRGKPSDDRVFRGLAGVQIVLVLAITLSALHRLRLYHDSYGLTDTRFYAMVLLTWIGVMLLWFALTVLRGRRDSFAFGAFVAGLSTVAVLFFINPDAIVARANLARMPSADPSVKFDAAYATSLSADALPVLINALPSLPREVQCPIAKDMLRRWGPEMEGSWATWNLSVSRASAAVGKLEGELRSMADECSAFSTPR